MLIAIVLIIALLIPVTIVVWLLVLRMCECKDQLEEHIKTFALHSKSNHEYLMKVREHRIEQTSHTNQVLQGIVRRLTVLETEKDTRDATALAEAITKEIDQNTASTLAQIDSIDELMVERIT